MPYHDDASFPFRRSTFGTCCFAVMLVLLMFVVAAAFVNRPAKAQAPVWECWNTQSTGTPPRQSCVDGLVGVKSSTAEASRVISSRANSRLMSVYAINSSATSGYLLVFNATSAPSDGAVTPLDCAPIGPNSYVSINYAPGPGNFYSTGIVAVLSSGADCFTKTSGTVTGFIKGSSLP